MANELVTTGGLAWMATAVGRALKGSGNPQTVTYIRRTARTFDPTAAAAVSDTSSSKSLTGTVIEADRTQAGVTGGALVFLCTVADFEAQYGSGVRPGSDDSLTYDGSTYEVADRWATDPAEVMLSITMQQVGA